MLNADWLTDTDEAELFFTAGQRAIIFRSSLDTLLKHLCFVHLPLHMSA
jgi:hypothetical protein